jgi:hypothetical protein
MTFSSICNDIFRKSATDYLVTYNVGTSINNPYMLKKLKTKPTCTTSSRSR